MIERASPKEMAPASKKGAISTMIFDNDRSYPSRTVTASEEANHG